MASYKLNMAGIRGCPDPVKVCELMREFGLPETEEFGVLDSSVTGKSVFGTIIRRTNQAVPRLEADSHDVVVTQVERVTEYPFCVQPASDRLEVYAGSSSAIEQVGLFLSGCLALPTVTDAIRVDVPLAIDKLMESTQQFQFRSLRVADHAHNSFMAGPYAPKFLDTQHGRDFMEEYADLIVSAGVKFMGTAGRVSVTLTPKACFSYSCQEEDQRFVQSTLRKLVWSNG